MGLINLASSKSIWRGIDYYKDEKVKVYNQISDYKYKGVVKGSNNNKYNIIIDIEHPRSSKCDCPYAKDRRVICKHIVALYFTVFPEEVERFLKKVEKAERDYEEYEEELYMKVIQYINSMSEYELKEALIEILDISPDWIYERFVRERIEI